MRFPYSYDSHADYRPFCWIRGYPLYLIQFLILAQVIGMVVTSITSGVQASWYSETMALQTNKVWNGWIWQWITYPFYDPPSLWWAIAMLLIFFQFGPEVERFIGRSKMAFLYLGLILAPSLLLTALSPLSGHSIVFFGSLDIMFGLFIAFCTLYPNAELFVWVPLSFKFAAWILLLMNSLIAIAGGAIEHLLALWIGSGFAYTYLKLLGVHGGFQWFENWREKRNLQKQAQQRNLRVMKRVQPTDPPIDQILEKISTQGIRSLTPEERAALEKERSALIRRDQK